MRLNFGDKKDTKTEKGIFKVDNHVTKTNCCVLVIRTEPVSKSAIDFLKLNGIARGKVHIPRNHTL